MIEMLWAEDTTDEDTRYKVLLPITTPPLPRPPQVINSESCNYSALCLLIHLQAGFIASPPFFLPDTVPGEPVFKVLLGPFGSDVALMNITFPSEVLSVADCNTRGFNVLEHMSPNGSSKVFTLEVPFTDPVVLQMVRFNCNMGFRDNYYMGFIHLGCFIFSFHCPTERNRDYAVLSSTDLWPAGPARVCSVLSHHLSGSSGGRHRFVLWHNGLCNWLIGLTNVINHFKPGTV